LVADRELHARVIALAFSRQPWAKWFVGEDFTIDWVTCRAPIWTQVLASVRDEYADVLEVGSFEGRSAYSG
jgi:hypothetical protein